MTDTMTTTDEDFIGQPAPLDLSAFLSAVDNGDIEVLEVRTAAHRSADDTETIVLGISGQRVQFTAPDLFEQLEEVRGWISGLFLDVLEARQAAVDAERHACACGVLLDQDESYCGSRYCAEYDRAERRDRAVI